ncbi:heparanase protein [Trifolium repens]|nr:heparanase protein [Trifolium repens]
MDVKSTICYTLILLFSISSAEDIKLIVKGVTNIATTDEHFICATLDWWPENKCDYNQCPWGKSGILNLDLGNKILSNAIKAFNPLRIRLGGSLQDQIIYQFGHQKHCPQIIKKDDGLFGFSVGCLPQNRWDEVNEFFNETGVKLTFGLNALIGKKNSMEDKKNYIGNELCSEGIAARIDSVQYAKDITKLRVIINKLYPNVATRPKVLGPAGFYGKEWFDSFLQNVGPAVIDGVTHHIYNFGVGVDKDLINKVQDPYFLSQIAQTFKDVSDSVRKFTPWAGAWVGESGGAYNSGGKDVSHTFVNGFWYLDQLGMTSTLDHKVFCRQTLIGGNYALLNTTTFIPNPDYYGALLWHRLMGSKLLSVSHEGSPYLRAYAHCSKQRPGIIVLIINMSKSTSNFSLVNDMNMYPKEYTTKGSVQTTNSSKSTDKQMREEYHLTPKDGNIQSDVVLLNGIPLKLTEKLDIPELKPIFVSSSSPIIVGPDSIVFVHIKDFNAPACA